jgi:hypothetical protein
VGKAIERIPLNDAARDAITRMLKRADELGHTNPEHYLWCASQHQRPDHAGEEVGRPGRCWIADSSAVRHLHG